MAFLPPLDIRNNTNVALHIMILGAGASLATFPNGDRHGKHLPLMQQLGRCAKLGRGARLLVHAGERCQALGSIVFSYFYSLC